MISAARTIAVQVVSKSFSRTSICSPLLSGKSAHDEFFQRLAGVSMQ